MTYKTCLKFVNNLIYEMFDNYIIYLQLRDSKKAKKYFNFIENNLKKSQKKYLLNKIDSADSEFSRQLLSGKNYVWRCSNNYYYSSAYKKTRLYLIGFMSEKDNPTEEYKERIEKNIPKLKKFYKFLRHNKYINRKYNSYYDEVSEIYCVVRAIIKLPIMTYGEKNSIENNLNIMYTYLDKILE